MTSKILECNNKHARDSVLEAALLGASASAEVQQHLETCASCAREWKEFASTMALLDEWEAPEPSPYFETRLRARVREEAEVPVSFWQRFLAPLASFSHGWRAAAVSAMGVIVIAGGIMMWEFNQPKEDACAVRDVQSLVNNADVLQEMNSIDATAPENQ